MVRRKKRQRVIYADDARENVGLLLRLRLPWLIVGLVGGTLASFLVSRFEHILAQNISLAFFLPLIIYISDAVGTQTETIFVRNIGKKKENFWVCLIKELFIGLILGALFGVLIGGLAWLWIKSFQIGLTVGLSMFAAVTTAPLVALIVPEILLKEHTDPALGAGPFTTIIQDLVSIMIYFVVAAIILFK